MACSQSCFGDLCSTSFSSLMGCSCRSILVFPGRLQCHSCMAFICPAQSRCSSLVGDCKPFRQLCFHPWLCPLYQNVAAGCLKRRREGKCCRLQASTSPRLMKSSPAHCSFPWSWIEISPARELARSQSIQFKLTGVCHSWNGVSTRCRYGPGHRLDH